MKKFIGLFVVTAMFSIPLLTLNTNAAGSANVNVTVTPENISITVADGTIDYGAMGLNSTSDTTSTGINDSQTATNNGNVTEDFNIRGQNSAAWTLAGTAGADQYIHNFCITTCDSTPVWNALTTSYQALNTGITSSGSTVFDLQINTPSSSSSFTQQDVSVTVQAVAN